MTELEKPKVVLCKAEGDTVVSRLHKALSAFAEVKELAFTSPDQLQPEKIVEEHKGFAAFFVDRELATKLSKLPARFCLFSRSKLSLHEILLKPESALLTTSCIDITTIPLPDLVRVCHSFVLNKSTPGVFSFVEKGSLITGEKIQSASNIGQTLDQFVHFITTERPSLVGRVEDARQMIAAVTFEGFKRTKEAEKEYPFVDIQISATADKIIFTARFPLGNLKFTELPHNLLNSSNLSWFLAWQGADLLYLTEFQAYQEVEIKALLFAKSTKDNEPVYRSLVFQSIETPTKGINLIANAKNYQFSLISELAKNKVQRQRELEGIQNSIVEEEEAKKDPEANLDPTIKLKIIKLEDQVRTMQSQLTTKDQQVRQGLAMIAEAKTAMGQKRSETLKLLKERENTEELLRKQLADYEKKLSSLNKQLAELKSATPSATKEESANKTDTNTKTLEREKQQLADALALEQKKFSVAETKMQQLKQDLIAKDKDILELKQTLEKLKREANKPAATPEATQKKESTKGPSDNEKALQTKVRELISKEDAYKQEIKTLKFKLENAEKTSKASSGESTDKIKLLEKKLEEAKAKEIDLLKKLEASQQPKKPAKAA